MKNINLATYVYQNEDEPFITSKIFKTVFPNIDISLNTILNNYIVRFYGLRNIRKTILNVTNEDMGFTLKKIINADCDIFVEANKEKYNGLYKTLFYDYNPISNYDMTEKENITVSPDIKENESNTRTPELKTETETTGTQSIGEKSDTSKTINGGVEVTSVNQVNPFNNTGYTNKEKNTTTTPENTVNVNATTGAQKNVSNSNTTTNETGTDKTEREYSRNGTETTEREFSRSGNIGVMSTQELIQKQREVLEFSFVPVLAHDIVNVITSGVYSI